VHKNDKNYP
jgi:hypothetical protein